MRRIILPLLLSLLLSDIVKADTTQEQLQKCDAAVSACVDYTKTLENQNQLQKNQITTVTQQRDQCGDQLAKCENGNPSSPILVGGVGAAGIGTAALLGGPAGALGAAGMFIFLLITKIHP